MKKVLGSSAGSALLLLAPCTNDSGSPPEAPLESCADNFQEHSRNVDIPNVKSPFGLVVADVDGDGVQDIVVASGGDEGLGTINIHFGKPGVPDWQSADEDYNARVVAGDVNKDGILDIAVAVFPPTGACDDSREGSSCPPAAKVYLSQDGQLPTSPAVLIPARASPTAPQRYSPEVALGDADGDGFLDLAVATLLSAGSERTHQRIYLNHGGTLDTEHPWVSETPVQANAIRFFDVNNDGLMDLVVTAPSWEWGWVFRGRVLPDGSVGIDKIAHEFPPLRTLPPRDEAVPGGLYTIDVDVGTFPENTLYAANTNHYCATEDCAGFLASYDNSGNLRWRSEETGMASAVRAGSVDGDPLDEVVAAFWEENKQCTAPQNCPESGPLFIYCGMDGSTVRKGQRIASSEKFLVERMVLTDLNGDATESASYVVTPSSNTAAVKPHVVTLPTRLVMGVQSIRRNDVPVPTSEYSFTPGMNWVSLAEPILPGERVEIMYTWTRAPDIVIADQTKTAVIPVIYHR